LGLAYKPDTGDARQSPAITVAQKLFGLGADVRAVDPHVRQQVGSEWMRRVALSEEEVAQADAVVLLTDHTAFDYDMVTAKASYILDTRRRLDGENTEHL
jgi:UDP-N-acetyl-D-glucosamine dehydrogenase